MGKDRKTGKEQIEELAPAISELVESLDHAGLEKVTIQSILEHRRLLGVAEAAYGALTEGDAASEPDASERHETYVRAMLSSKAQMAVVAVLVDRLGYVPDIIDERA